MNLKYKNLFHYLVDAGIYQEDDLEDLKIDLSSQASNWLIELPWNLGKVFVKQTPHQSGL